MSDLIKKPAHYAEGRTIEPIEVIEDWGLDYHLGNTVKYISRAGRKDDVVQDLEQARAYLTRRINLLRGAPSWDEQ